MLGKLIAYEFRASGRLIPLVYVVVAMLGIAGGILSAIEAYVYMTLAFILLFLAGAAALIITCVIIFLRFHKGMFGSEGYLAMTLPANTTQLYLSKTIVAAVWMTLGTLVTAFSWLMAFASLFREFFYGEFYWDVYEELFEFYATFFTPGVWLYLIVISVVGYLSFAAQVYFCVTISNVPPFQGIGVGAAIIAYIALQVVNRILSTALNYFIPIRAIYDSYTGWSLVTRSHWSHYTSYSDFSIGLAGNILPFLYAFALPVLTIWLINHRVNLK